MAVNSEANNPKVLPALDLEVKRLLVDATYSGRGHLVAAGRWNTTHIWVGLPLAILSAVLASGAGLTALVGGTGWLTATLAFLSVILKAIDAWIRPGDRAKAHALKGNRYLSLRNDARLFREIELRLPQQPVDLMQRLRDLRERYNALNESEPQIPGSAYRAAKQGIERGESDYANDPLWVSLG